MSTSMALEISNHSTEFIYHNCLRTHQIDDQLITKFMMINWLKNLCCHSQCPTMISARCLLHLKEFTCMQRSLSLLIWVMDLPLFACLSLHLSPSLVVFLSYHGMVSMAHCKSFEHTFTLILRVFTISVKFLPFSLLL